MAVGVAPDAEELQDVAVQEDDGLEVLVAVDGGAPGSCQQRRKERQWGE